MEDDTLAGHLAALGLTEPETSRYLRLLSAPADPGGDPGGGAEPDGASRAAEDRRLIALGLAAVSPAGARTLIPVPPGTALELLSRRSALRLKEAQAAVTAAYERYRRRHPAAGDGTAAEELTGEDAERRLAAALTAAEDEVLCLDNQPPVWRGELGTATAVSLMRRGVRHRTVYAQAAFDRPGHLSGAVEPRMAAGEQARTLPGLPVWLTLIDDRVAFVAGPPADGDDACRGLLAVRPGALLTALRALFEACWDRALPLPVPQATGSSAATRPGPAERRILAMLAAGAPDSQIVRELGVSRRTFFRRMELLMAQAGAGSRFQLALQAQRRGWL